MPRITLLTGGARSGKSRRALEMARRSAGTRVFIATAEPADEEMRQRIARHRDERGSDFLTREEPLDLAGALRSLPADVAVAVVDCVTVWLGNLMHHQGDGDCEPRQVSEFLAALRDPPCDLIVVTNELGMSIVPANPMARRFRDTAGRLNQQLAGLADEVVLMVSGLPLVLKGRER